MAIFQMCNCILGAHFNSNQCLVASINTKLIGVLSWLHSACNYTNRIVNTDSNIVRVS